MLNNKLKKYNAKDGGPSIYHHNKDLENILNQLNLEEAIKEQMKKIIKYHDIGKAVSSFQDNITNTSREIRHEMLSASVASLTEEEMLVILSHHKPLKEIIGRFDRYPEVYKDELKELEEITGVKTVDIRDRLKKYKRIKTNKILKDKNIIHLKGILNYCDHLGSSSIDKIDKGKDLRKVFEFDSYTSVQEKAKNISDDMILIAPTGSGKTEASLYWASNINKKKDKKVFYILPYCASITAMYKRLTDSGVSVGMLHSKATYNLYKGLGNQSQAMQEYQGYKYFTKHITITTTHQIFKAVFNCKFNEMILSMFQDSIFIIDEIHSYDQRETALILQTLKYLKDNYNIKICVMSASIPTNLKDLLRTELEINKELKMSDSELEKIKRHKVKYIDRNIEDDIGKIKDELRKGKKIIICVNTVAKSLEMYNLLKNSIKVDKITLINSYFNTRDREKIERELKDSKLLIGTQAIEVSLDIDFDEMYTEISVIDSQIQRWGRINRKRIEKLKERKNIYIYNTESKVYDEALIKRTKTLLKSLGRIGERDVQKYLDEVYIDELNEYKKYKRIMLKVLNNIQMGKWERSNELFEFTGVSVIPESLEDEYRNLIEESKYFEANSLVVNIPKWQFSRASKDNAIILEKFKNKHEYVILYKYNSKKGLMFGEKENNFF